MLEDAPRAPVERGTPWQQATEWARAGVESLRERPGRAIVGVVAALAVAVALWWLLRPPPAVAPETVLPMATTVATSPSAEAAGSAADTTGAATTVAPASTVVVHVVGAVARPGVLRLPDGSRVVDAIAAAGGAVAEADTARVNLAARLGDGEWIHVPRAGEVSPAPPAGASSAAAGAATGRDTGPVDLNRASAEQLDTLPGVGPATAAAIVEHRERHGPFASVDSLADVPGIGAAKLARLRPLVRV